MHRKRYLRMKARALELEQDLPAKLRRKPVDYRNLMSPSTEQGHPFSARLFR
jgi:hypothetical protein